jgi:hypothetical protein
MTWIRTVPPGSADAALAAAYSRVMALYPQEYGPPVDAVTRPDGSSDSVVAAHSLLPEAMEHMMSGLAVLLRPGLPLGRREQEMIATAVSAANRCFY